MLKLSKIGGLLAAAALALGVAGTSQAATVAWSALPLTATPNPVANATNGTVAENVIGSVANVRRSPWLDAPVDTGLLQNDPTAYYTSVQANSWAEYTFTPRNVLSFVWGSPDLYNSVEFYLGGVLVDAFAVTGANAAAINAAINPARLGTNAAIATFGNIGRLGLFDTVRMTSTASNAFEFANLRAVSTVPVPAAGLLLVSALGGIAAMRRRKAA